MAAPKPKAPGVIEIPPIHMDSFEVALLGTQPVILHRLSEKSQRQLLAPPPTLTRAAKQANIKHDPLAEFQASPYLIDPSEEDPAPLTHLAALSVWFKKAMMTAALDLPGAVKAQIGRLVWVQEEYSPLYGIPRYFMRYVRQSGMTRTPDIRTRAIVPKWACLIQVRFVETMIKAPNILNLLTAAGMTSGIGDWRNEKGSGTYGQFEVVMPTDARLPPLLAQGYAAQVAAMKDPEPYDLASEELLAAWAEDTRDKRFTHPSAPEETDDLDTEEEED